jgi:hypothetical protein
MNKPEVSQPINMQSAAEMGTEEYHDISWVSNRQISRFSNCRYLISVLSIVPPKKKPELCDQALAVSKKSD